MKDDEDPTAFVDRNTLHHFNARGHFRTQSAEDARREKRRSRVMEEAAREQEMGSSGDVIVKSIIVFGILLGAYALPAFLLTPK